MVDFGSEIGVAQEGKKYGLGAAMSECGDEVICGGFSAILVHLPRAGVSHLANL